MKKFLLVLTVFILSTAAFSQSTISLSWEFGPIIQEPPSITFNGAPDAGVTIYAHVGVTNTGTEAVSIRVARTVHYAMENSVNMFCWGGQCFPPNVDTSLVAYSIAPGETYHEFSGDYQPNSTYGVSTIQYTFYDENNPANFAYVIVNFNTLFSVESTAGDSLGAHMRSMSGTVDDTLSGGINIVNHAPIDMNLLVFKGIQLVPNGTINWFDFGGMTYPAGQDTSAIVSVPGMATDESFMAHYYADGIEGGGQIVYAFQSPENPAAYALMLFSYAAALDIDEDILALTEFSSAYPNPAENTVSFDYDIPGEVSQARIIMTNLLGAVVYETTLNGLAGTERIDVSDFSEGIYFATLILDNNIATSQKIIVQ